MSLFLKLLETTTDWSTHVVHMRSLPSREDEEVLQDHRAGTCALRKVAQEGSPKGLTFTFFIYLYFI